MEDEIYFICEVCGKKCPANPDMMLECSADFNAINSDTGDIIELDEQTRKEVLEEAKSDPEIRPFLKGAICMCIECQDNFSNNAETSVDDEL